MNKRMSCILVIVLVIGLAAVVVFRQRQSSSLLNSSRSLQSVSLRLEWYPQAQFCGYLVAKDLGYYRDAGLNVDLRPAGPDFKPQVSVAAGTDDIGVGVSNQVIAARSNGVPLKIIAQLMQDSANRYVLKRANAIQSLTELRGKKIGLWLGGDEVEFVAMLKSVGMTLNDVQVIPQGQSVTPFLQNQYVVSQVTVYNELIQIENHGYIGDKLQILSPADYNAAIDGDMLFTTERYIAAHPDVVRRFLAASLQGWQYCIKDPSQAVDIVLRYNNELNQNQQRQQLAAIIGLIEAGNARTMGLGYMDPVAYATANRILLDSGQIKQSVEPTSVFDATPWTQLSPQSRAVP